MHGDLLVIASVAASIAAVHTLSGPDHYLPFLAMAKARDWSWSRTIWITSVCGLGHVASSVVLALLGSAALVGSEHLLGIESLRGEVAAWGLIAFGLIYTVWGIRSAIRRRPHHHEHVHVDGTRHVHEHRHSGGHLHAHPEPRRRRITPWVLFTIFVFGPCEPLIPLLMYPAVQKSVLGFVFIASLFAVITIATMLAVVLLGLSGMRWLQSGFLERYAHAFAGVAVLACGVAVRFLGL